jgi:hypothetical protein
VLKALPTLRKPDNTNLIIFFSDDKHFNQDQKTNSQAVLWIRIRIRRIHMFLGLPDPDPLVRGMDPDPAPDLSIMQK